MTQESEAIPPVVCTLSTKARAQRGLEWADLGKISLTSERIDGGVTSTFPLEVADQVEDLANSEMSCCGSWLTISTTRTAETIELEVTTTNPDGLTVITDAIGLSPS
jgi:hypothetical protein